MDKRSVRASLVALTLAVMLSMLASPASASSATDDTQTPAYRYNATLASTLFRSVFNGGNSNATETLIAPNATILTPYGTFTGPEGLQSYLDIQRRVYPDAWFEITSINVYGDTVVVRWEMVASRYITGSASNPVNVRVANPGQTTITFVSGQVTSLNQQESDTAAIRNSQVASPYGTFE